MVVVRLICFTLSKCIACAPYCPFWNRSNWINDDKSKKNWVFIQTERRNKDSMVSQLSFNKIALGCWPDEIDFPAWLTLFYFSISTTRHFSLFLNNRILNNDWINFHLVKKQWNSWQRKSIDNRSSSSIPISILRNCRYKDCGVNHESFRKIE